MSELYWGMYPSGSATRRHRAEFDALSALWTRWGAFRSRAFPREWAKVVNGVGLASLSMRAERALNLLFGYFPPGKTNLRNDLTTNLATALAWCDEALPALPDEPRHYFEELRSIVGDAAALIDKLPWVDRPPYAVPLNST